jgi:hypothetical protein
MRLENDLALRVLSTLLDKYERSQAFLRNEAQQRRIQVRLTDAVVPGYVSGWFDPDARHALHAGLQRFAEEGLIELQWVKFEHGNILDKVYLVWDGIDKAYARLGRTPRREELAALADQLRLWLQAQALLPGWEWIRDWVRDVLEAVEQRGRASVNLLPQDPALRELLLRALSGLIDKGDAVLPMRLFSKRYLGDSKAFERQVQGRLLGMVRKYALPCWGELDPEVLADDADLLRELGIEVTHDDVAFCGPVRFRFAGHSAVVDGRAFPHGLAIDAADAGAIEVVDLPISRILTIENKANYREYVRRERQSEELVVYLGGFASPGQRRFLRRLRAFVETHGLPLPRFHHWGDLDYGGILILQHLRDTCWPEAEPWRMEPEMLDTYASLLEPLDDAYREKLRRLLENDKYRWAWPLVERLLEAGGTLEQEALLV